MVLSVYTKMCFLWERSKSYKIDIRWNFSETFLDSLNFYCFSLAPKPQGNKFYLDGPTVSFFHQPFFSSLFVPTMVAQSICLQCGRPGFDPWVGKIPWRRKWQPTPVFLPGESHGWRSLVGYSPRGCKESDTTEWLHFTSLHHNLYLSIYPSVYTQVKI